MRSDLVISIFFQCYCFRIELPPPSQFVARCYLTTAPVPAYLRIILHLVVVTHCFVCIRMENLEASPH